MAVWLVADFEALTYQVTTTFETSCAHVLFDQALLAEGGLPDDPAAYVRRVNALLA